jgi:hypothetical protein
MIVNKQNRKVPLSHDELSRFIEEVFRGKEFREMTTTELMIEIQKKVDINNRALLNRLPHVNILLSEKRSNKNYYKLHENYREMMTDKTFKRCKKIDSVKEMIINILNNSLNNTILYKDLVNILKQEYNFAVGTIYYVIQKNLKLLKIIKNEDGKKYITFLENKDNVTAENLKKEEIRNLILGGENDMIEFKSSLRWDYKLNQVNKTLELVIAKTISGFLNSKGGKILIGVNDDGVILGIGNDYNTLSKKNYDGFLQMFTNIVNNYIGKEFFRYLSPRKVKIDEMDICVVDIERSVHNPELSGHRFRFYSTTNSDSLCPLIP